MSKPFCLFVGLLVLRRPDRFLARSSLYHPAGLYVRPAPLSEVRRAELCQACNDAWYIQAVELDGNVLSVGPYRDADDAVAWAHRSLAWRFSSTLPVSEPAAQA